MKKILVIVLAGLATVLTSCAKKTEQKQVLHLYRSVIFLPKLLVGTAD